MRSLVLLAILATPVFADPKPDIAQLVTGDPSGAAFAFVGNGNYANASTKEMRLDVPAKHTVKNVVGGFSKNKKSYWESAEVVNATNAVDGHASAVWDKSGSTWKLVAFSLMPTSTNQEQQDALKKGITPAKVSPQNGAGDEYFLTVFGDVFGESASETVATDRKEAVLFGSGANERYVGGTTVKKTLASWKLSFKVRDGMADGKTSGRLLWIGANLDATSGKTTTPYRAFLVFEGDGNGGYSLLHASFGAVTEQGWR